MTVIVKRYEVLTVWDLSRMGFSNRWKYKLTIIVSHRAIELAGHSAANSNGFHLKSYGLEIFVASSGLIAPDFDD